MGNGTSQGASRNLLRQKVGLSYGRGRCAHKEPSRLVMLVQEQARGGVCARNPKIWYLWNEKKKKNTPDQWEMNLYFHSLSAGHCKHRKRKNSNSPCLNVALAPSAHSLWACAWTRKTPSGTLTPCHSPLVSALGAWGVAGWYSREQGLLGFYEMSEGHPS